MKNPINIICSLLFLPMMVIAFDASGNEQGKTVESFVNAFNERDIPTMLNIAAPDMRWMSVSGDAISLETSSAQQLKAAMQSYFESIPTAKSTIRSLSVSGTFVYALEQASWQSKGKMQSQCSMAVYEFAGQKIQNVWYFPSHQCL